MLFSRGSWSIVGIRKTTLDTFRASLEDANTMLGVSQLMAATKAKVDGIPTYGINPFEFPRLDEDLLDCTGLMEQIEKEDIKPDNWSDYYGIGDSFSLHDDQYGFWLVLNEDEDTSDPKSKAEGLAYKEANKPFKFLSKTEKGLIETSVTAAALPSRSQFPVLIDFNSETVYIASANVEQVGYAVALINSLGGETFNLAWSFDSSDWPQRFLFAVNDENRFSTEMATRAEELSRFDPSEVEKLDDRMMESIVSTFFSLSELETGQWVGLKTPARIRLYKPSDPVSVSNPSVAFSITQKFDGGQISGASTVFQNLESRFTKKGEERQVRIDLFTLDVNDNMNLTDAGAALLRGFDLPSFKKDIKKAIKDRESNMNIYEYWKEWLSGMKTSINIFVDNVTETLKIDKQKYGLKPYKTESEE